MLRSIRRTLSGRTRLPKEGLASRLAAGVLALLLTLVGVAAVGGITRIRAATHHARQAALQSEAYHQLAYDGAVELAIEQRYLSAPSRALLDAHAHSAARLGLNLRAAIRDETNPSRRRALEALVGPFDSYVKTVDQMFEAVERGDGRAVSATFQREIYPGFVAIVSVLERDAARGHQRALTALDSLTHTETSVLEATVLMLVLGFVLIGACLTILAVYRRRADRVREEELQRLRVAALTDPLTGLGNFRAFRERGNRELETLSDERPISLTMLDLDGLKMINDRLGHHRGDEQLCRVAEELRALTPPGGQAYRIGGDEFAVLAPEQPAWDAFTTIMRLRQRLDETATCGISAGIADADRPLSLTELTRRADLARREAKASNQGALVFTSDLATRQPAQRSADDRHVRTLASALARAVDAKDSYTRSHSQTVSQISAQIAEQLGLPPSRVAKVRLAGLLHDVGKIGISDSILHKPGPLTDAEYEIIKTHSVLGHSILSSAELEEEAEWVLHHHEHWNGAGYPAGLSAEQIPLESRIVHVADAFEAITSDRPYRRGRSSTIALEELHRHAGTQFDVKCVQALERAIHRHAEEILSDDEQLVAAT